MTDHSQTDLTGLDVGIWGLGREGISMAKTASAAGAAHVVAVDDASKGTLDVPEELAEVTVLRGSEHLDRFDGCDVVFVSPGVPWRHPVFEELRRSGKRISNAADWYMARNGSRTIGVTGTKGKSTTASFLAHLLSGVGVHAVVAGNIGTPLSDLAPDDEAVVVAELSSQQCALLTTSPSIAIITNLHEDHLDWHGDVDAYHLAKANIFRNGAHSLVCTREVIDVLERVGVASFPPALDVLAPADLRRGEGLSVMAFEHNVVNGALAVMAAGEWLGRAVTPEEADAAVESFEGLPHRLQTVRSTGPTGRPTRWIDDTLATTGESVVAALTAMRPDDNVVLIVGGMDRQLNYQQVDDYLCSGSRRVELIQAPSNGASIGAAYARKHPEKTHVATSLEDAVRAAATLPDIDVVLLSPGAASYDLYPNYIAKAAAYCGFIDGLAGPVGTRN
jgi:UDP-N-acetylmuramoyl-L-alanine---L-glutamate ligase